MKAPEGVGNKQWKPWRAGIRFKEKPRGGGRFNEWNGAREARSGSNGSNGRNDRNDRNGRNGNNGSTRDSDGAGQ